MGSAKLRAHPCSQALIVHDGVHVGGLLDQCPSWRSRTASLKWAHMARISTRIGASCADFAAKPVYVSRAGLAKLGQDWLGIHKLSFTAKLSASSTNSRTAPLPGQNFERHPLRTLGRPCAPSSTSYTTLLNQCSMRVIVPLAHVARIWPKLGQS